MTRGRASGVVAWVAWALLATPGVMSSGALGLMSGCGNDNCCSEIDAFPIDLARAPMGGGRPGNGALLAQARDLAGADPYWMVVSTGTSYSALAGEATPSLATFRGGFDLQAARSGLDPAAPLRARFRGIDLLSLPLGDVGAPGTVVGGILGGNLLRSFSVDFRFAPPCPAGSTTCPGASMTLWFHLGADDGFLSTAGYAVVRFNPFGGGEVTAQGPPDFLGQRGPWVLPASRVVLRGCAVPTPFDPATEPLHTCCARTDASSLANAPGANLALLVDTGIGPLVLGQAAWDRVVAAARATGVELAAPTLMPGSLSMAGAPTPIDASWSEIPRLALVNLEAGGNDDPGACVELGRARRIEWVSYQNVKNAVPACVQPCDTDVREPQKAQSSAAYIELGGAIPVAVVADDTLFLQSLRFDVRPEGPELDGIIGAGALGSSRVELDFLSSQPRALFTCEPEAPREACRAAPRCPRLPSQDDLHSCFGFGPHGLPAMCADNGCGTPSTAPVALGLRARAAAVKQAGHPPADVR